MNHLKQTLRELSGTAVLGLGAALAAVFEAITCFSRFGLGYQSTRDTSWMQHLTFGYRIHHGYIGVVLLVIASFFFPPRDARKNLLLIVGIALVVSDLCHHFLVLWPITGSPQFDIVYPEPGQ